MSDSDPVILVIEDNPANLLLVRTILELESMSVVSATTVAEGRRLAFETKVDLILMDLRMPDGDGLELTRELKAIEALANVPIIALTAHAMSGDADVATAAGCDGFITKPLNSRTFAGEVRRHLS